MYHVLAFWSAAGCNETKIYLMIFLVRYYQGMADNAKE